MNSFDKEPIITIHPKNTEKPFTLMNDIEYLSEKYHGFKYRIFINKGYNWNGANIPRIFWRIVGSQYNPEFAPASMVHDWLCENKSFIEKHGVQVSSDIFRDILILYKVPKCKAKIMATAVRLWQYTQRGWK